MPRQLAVVDLRAHAAERVGQSGIRRAGARDQQMSRPVASDATDRENATNPDERQPGCQQRGARSTDYCSE